MQKSLSILHDDAKPVVITGLELIGIIVFYLLIFFVLFPKDQIAELAIQESENYDLATNYLENIVSKYPNSKAESIALAKLYARQAKFEAAFSVLNKLSRKQHQKVQSRELLALHFDIAKQKFFTNKNAENREKLYSSLKALIIASKQESDLLTLHTAAVSLNMPDLKLLAASRLAEISHDFRWKRNALNDAFDLENLKVIKSLTPKTLNASTSVKLHYKAFNFYYQNHMLQQAAEQALWIHNHAESAAAQREWLQTTFQMLTATNNFEAADALSKRMLPKALSDRHLATVLITYCIPPYKSHPPSENSQSLARQRQRLSIAFRLAKAWPEKEWNLKVLGYAFELNDRKIIKALTPEILNAADKPELHQQAFNFYYRNKRFRQAADQALWLLDHSGDRKKQRLWLRTSLQMLGEAKQLERADRLAGRMEKKAKSDKRIYKIIMTYYLNNEKLQKAHNLASKVLEENFRFQEDEEL